MFYFISFCFSVIMYCSFCIYNVLCIYEIEYYKIMFVYFYCVFVWMEKSNQRQGLDVGNSFALSHALYLNYMLNYINPIA